MFSLQKRQKKKKNSREKLIRMTSTQSSSLSFTSSFASSSRKQQQQQRRRRRAHSFNNVVVVKASTNNDEFVSALNAKFSIPTSVSFFERDETSSSPYVSLTHKNGSTAKVYLFGANCASWTQPTGDEVLFVRPDAKFDESVPIAGE